MDVDFCLTVPLLEQSGFFMWLFGQHKNAKFALMFDIFIVVVSVIAFVRGAFRGLIGELAGLAAIALGLYGAGRFGPMTEELIAPYFAGYPTRLIAFGLTLLVIVLAVYFISNLVTRFAKMAHLSVPNRIAGGVFGVAKVLLIVSGVLGLANRMWPGDEGLLTEQQKDEMVTYRFVESFAGYAFPYIDKGLDEVKNINPEN